MKIIKQNIKLYKMAYKMDPTKKKNKNGAINKIAKGIAKAAETMIVGPIGSIAIGKYKQFKQSKNQSPILPSIQPSNGNGNKETTKRPEATAEPGGKKATTEPGGKKMKKTLTNLKRTKTSSVPRSQTIDLQPTAPKVNIKGTTLGNEKADGPNVTVYGKKKAKAAPKKVKVKIKNNKTKIKIKK
jgi:hypothetical protein